MISAAQTANSKSDAMFTEAELQAMHRYCLKYRELVHSGGTPTQEQDGQFMAFQNVCYGEGVALGQR